MTQFNFDIDSPSRQFIRISAKFKTLKKETFLQLPSWRPGRYELADFAKYIRNLNVFDSNGKKRTCIKVTKDKWRVDTSSTDFIIVKYCFYANTINAGSSFLDDSQLYVNPVNCCFFIKDSFNDKVQVRLNIPSNWMVATSMIKNSDFWECKDMEELFDSPFIASNKLQYKTYISHNIKFFIWFNGEIKPNWDDLIKDFKSFTDIQIEKFTEFPVTEYHFLNQILPYKAYHGVEHYKSTVITIGPSYDVFGSLYKEFLGVSSHELYHTWNVKSIRPIEMLPYDFTKENYSRLGYLYEGVTTYQGDLFLLKSGLFNEQDYFNELQVQFQKHFDNHGRFNYSVAESSFDTWLDGYDTGVPNRKVSIYTEGCILGFVTDVNIRRLTSNKYGLDEVMKRLYFNYAINGKGVSEKNYKELIEDITGVSQNDFFDNYINGCLSYESIITKSLDYLGLELKHEPSRVYMESKLGFKVMYKDNECIVNNIYPGSPAELSGLYIGDKIISVNDFVCNVKLDKWLSYFDNDQKKIKFIRNGEFKDVILPEGSRNFYMKYTIQKNKDANKEQIQAFNKWKQ
tara:strand:- start:1122 stop:2831 length:1710 start_codon:yes stop_codon:yes gene_type:complete